MPAITATMERREIFDSNRRRLSNAALIASTIAVLAFLLAFVVLPILTPKLTRVEIPPRVYKLEQIATLMPPPRVAPEQVQQQQLNAEPIPDQQLPKGNISEPAVRRTVEPPLAPDAGKIGQERAEAATARLASATSKIDRTLMGLTASLEKGRNGLPEGRARRDLHVDGGRSEGDLGSYRGTASSGGSTDLSGSRVGTTGVAIGTIAAPSGDAGEAASADAADGAGAPPGLYRSNASLLAVIQRYAAGIQYCYENELRRQPKLAGKLVVTITVAASGEVTDARVVQDGLGSSKLSNCALSQIREWRFPPVAKGTTTFQTPFVFTPPN
jgi:TonB family protein